MVLFLGANDRFDAVTNSRIQRSETADLNRPAHVRKTNLWTPEYFQMPLDRVAPKVPAAHVGRVLVGTNSRVTTPPVPRGARFCARP